MEREFIKAARKGNLELVESYIEQGISLESMDQYGWTALMLAAWLGHNQVVEWLLSKGANVDATSQTGCTALIGAARCGHTQVVEMLLSNGANVDATIQNGFMKGYTALMFAVRSGCTQIVELLLSNDANVNATDAWENTALIMAEWNLDRVDQILNVTDSCEHAALRLEYLQIIALIQRHITKRNEDHVRACLHINHGVYISDDLIPSIASFL